MLTSNLLRSGSYGAMYSVIVASCPWCKPAKSVPAKFMVQKKLNHTSLFMHAHNAHKTAEFSRQASHVTNLKLCIHDIGDLINNSHTPSCWHAHNTHKNVDCCALLG